MSNFSQRLSNKPYDVGLIAGCLGLIFATAWAYFPGLNGPFIFDDFGSVAALGHRGGVVDWETFKAFVLGGHSGPTGRPVSLLSFLIDANNWPADAWPFKRTNLVIHCLCGVVLASLTQQILMLLGYSNPGRRWLVIAVTGVWMLHPFLVSTTLYVVQRMAQLSTLFVLTGLYVFIRGRLLLPTNVRKAYLLMTVSIVLFTVLATLSKENGFLLPLLAVVMEATVIASRRESLGHLNRYWSIVFLGLPAMLFLAYLGTRVFRADFFDVVPPREFSIYERSLSQTRIVFDYLQHWFIPKLYTTGVFQDHYEKSTGIFSPLTTVVSLIAHVGIITVAVLRRRRWPILAFGILFFYTSHLMESTVVNLELYFEHRNYLGTAFLSLAGFTALHRKLTQAQFVLIVAALLMLLGSFTRYSSSVWSSWPNMVEVSAKKAPMSERLQAQYSVLLFRSGLEAESLEVLDRAIDRIPGPNALLRVNRLVSLCELNQLRSEEFDNEARDLATLPYDPRLIRVYTMLAENVVTGQCPDVDGVQLLKLFAGMLKVPYNSAPDSLQYSQVQYLNGFAYVYLGRPDDAVAAFQESLGARPGASHAMLMAAVLASNHYGQQALFFSDLALAEISDPSATNFDVAPVSQADILIFQDTVRADIKAAQEEDSSRGEK